MSEPLTVDPFAGTAYRHLADALDALEMARYHGHDDAIGYDPAAALADLDAVTIALEAARAVLLAAATPTAADAEIIAEGRVHCAPCGVWYLPHDLACAHRRREAVAR